MMYQFESFKLNGRRALFITHTDKWNFYIGFRRFIEYLE